MKYIYVFLSLSFVIISLIIMIKEGVSLTDMAGLVFFLILMIVFINQKKMAPLVPSDELKKMTDALSIYNEFEVDEEIVSASCFATITTIKEDHYNHRELYSVAELNIPLQTLDDFFTAAGTKKYSTVYSTNINGSGLVISNMIAFDNLFVTYSATGLVLSMFWGNKGSAKLIKDQLKGFPKEYPMIWVDWASVKIDSLNSSHLTGLLHWEFKEEKNEN